MAIQITQGFQRLSSEPIDSVFTLSKLEMKNIDDVLMPEKYFAICLDDGKFYLYSKGNTKDETTGKFRVFDGGAGSYEELTNLPQINGRTLIGDKLSADLGLQDEMAEITNQEIDNIIYGG